MDISLRRLIRADRSAIINLLLRVEEFDPEDVKIATELLDIYLNQPDQKDYEFIVAVDVSGQVLGFACYGPTPLTDRTYDLYWIATDPDYAGKGIGTRMFQAVEDCLQQAHGRLLVIETSSRPVYANTQRFYLKCGCQLGEVIKDFYREGEDRLTYIKPIARSRLESASR